jgi:hypothetical protein
MLKPEDVVNVVVTEKPQRVYAAVNGVLHVGKWRTVNPGENGVTKLDDTSNELLLNAAMYKWCGETHFTTTVQDLDDHSNGYGVQPN